MHLEETTLEILAMVNWLSVEDRIKMEYGAARAFIALNPYWSVLGALCFGWLVGHVL